MYSLSRRDFLFNLGVGSRSKSLQKSAMQNLTTPDICEYTFDKFEMKTKTTYDGKSVTVQSIVQWYDPITREDMMKTNSMLFILDTYEL